MDGKGEERHKESWIGWRVVRVCVLLRAYVECNRQSRHTAQHAQRTTLTHPWKRGTVILLILHSLSLAPVPYLLPTERDNRAIAKRRGICLHTGFATIHIQFPIQSNDINFFSSYQFDSHKLYFRANITSEWKAISLSVYSLAALVFDLMQMN